MFKRLFNKKATKVYPISSRIYPSKIEKTTNIKVEPQEHNLKSPLKVNNNYNLKFSSNVKSNSMYVNRGSLQESSSKVKSHKESSSKVKSLKESSSKVKPHELFSQIPIQRRLKKFFGPVTKETIHVANLHPYIGIGMEKKFFLKIGDRKMNVHLIKYDDKSRYYSINYDINYVGKPLKSELLKKTYVNKEDTMGRYTIRRYLKYFSNNKKYLKNVDDLLKVIKNSIKQKITIKIVYNISELALLYYILDEINKISKNISIYLVIHINTYKKIYGFYKYFQNYEYYMLNDIKYIKSKYLSEGKRKRVEPVRKNMNKAVSLYSGNNLNNSFNSYNVILKEKDNYYKKEFRNYIVSLMNNYVSELTLIGERAPPSRSPSEANLHQPISNNFNSKTHQLLQRVANIRKVHDYNANQIILPERLKKINLLGEINLNEFNFLKLSKTIESLVLGYLYGYRRTFQEMLRNNNKYNGKLLVNDDSMINKFISSLTGLKNIKFLNSSALNDIKEIPPHIQEITFNFKPIFISNLKEHNIFKVFLNLYVKRVYFPYGIDYNNIANSDNIAKIVFNFIKLNKLNNIKFLLFPEHFDYKIDVEGWKRYSNTNSDYSKNPMNFYIYIKTQ